MICPKCNHDTSWRYKRCPFCGQLLEKSKGDCGLEMKDRRVVCAAVRDSGGRIAVGPRHFDKIMVEAINNFDEWSRPWEQGFIDQHGEFMTREEAYVVATEVGQIIRRCGGDEQRLFSENLY